MTRSLCLPLVFCVTSVAALSTVTIQGAKFSGNSSHNLFVLHVSSYTSIPIVTAVGALRLAIPLFWTLLKSVVSRGCWHHSPYMDVFRYVMVYTSTAYDNIMRASLREWPKSERLGAVRISGHAVNIHFPEAYVKFPREGAAAITDNDVVVVEVHAKQPPSDIRFWQIISAFFRIFQDRFSV